MRGRHRGVRMPERPVVARPVALVAALAFLLQTFLFGPLPPFPAAGAVPVCTAAGLVWLDPATGEPAAPPADRTPRRLHLCCLAHHAAARLPEPVQIDQVLVAIPVGLRRLPDDRPVPSRSAVAHRPRAPPSFPPSRAVRRCRDAAPSLSRVLSTEEFACPSAATAA